MSSFANRYWNLTQAAAWVVYRSRQLVEDSLYPSRLSWVSFDFFFTVPARPKHGSVQELQNALIDGRLFSWGRRNSEAGQVIVIPPIEWVSLQVELPAVYRRDPEKGKVLVWFDIRLESKDLRKHWRSIPEKEGRTRYDWKKVRGLWEEARNRLPDVSENEVIAEIEKVFAEQFNKPSPSRTSIQSYIKVWKAAASR